MSLIATAAISRFQILCSLAIKNIELYNYRAVDRQTKQNKTKQNDNHYQLTKLMNVLQLESLLELDSTPSLFVINE
jgi:hypothetical protein